jgi:6-pyruvoyltetrahydropterin/6-carboxytetrahydropterin synthase
MQITREFGFDAAHRIPGHRGKCAWLHGHSYRLAVTVAAERLDTLDMVIDFEDLDAIVRSAVLDRWDHATLLRHDDPLAPVIATVQAQAPDRLVLFGENPTAEILAREAFEAIVKRLPDGVALNGVTVWETPTASSRYDRGHSG